MAEDDEDGGDLSPEEMSAQVEREFRAQRMKRAKQKLLERTSSKHLVESSLEDFVMKARGAEVDTASFAKESREDTLARELVDLKKRLADAEARLAAEVSKPRPRRWAHIAAAFAIGAASMFAVSFAMKRDEPPAEPHAQQVEPPRAPAPPPPPPPPPPVEPAPAVAPAIAEAPRPEVPKAKKARPLPPKKQPAEKPKQDQDGLYNPF